MRTTCMIKSHPKGLTLVLDADAPYDQIVLDTCKLFAESKDFFKETSMILSIEGRQLSPQETLGIIEAIEINSKLKISLLLDDSELRDVRTLGQIDRFFFERTSANAKIIKGNIKANETVSSDTGVLVMGDVKKNAKVVAAGSVYVAGKLEGEVIAGDPDDDTVFIAAGRMLAKSATIAGQTQEIKIKYRGLRVPKKNNEPVVVRLLHGRFQAEQLSGGIVLQEN